MSGEVMIPGSGAARSLAADLRARSDDEIAALLRARPDLMTPLPSDLAQLAARATTRVSVLRALDRLDRHALQVLDALVLLPDPTTEDEVRALLGSGDGLPAALARLRAQALLWGPAAELRLVRTVREAIGPAPADLGPSYDLLLPSVPRATLDALAEDLGLPIGGSRMHVEAAVARHLIDPATIDALVAAAPPAAREALTALAEGPAYGRLDSAQRPTRTATARTPIEWLLARGLLVAVDPATVVLPMEVGLRVRGGRVHPEVAATPPPLVTRPVDARLVDHTAAAAAFTAVRLVEDLLEAWGVEPPSVLRAGGLGVRELRRAAAALDVDERTAALLVEVAYVAGLVGTDTTLDASWLPTPAYDSWRDRSVERRWATLATAWLETTRVPSLVGERDERDKARNALGPDLDRMAAPDVRRAALAVLAGAAPGSAVEPAGVAEQLRWSRPLRGGPLRDRLVEATLREAEVLGVTGRGALSGPGRLLIAGDEAAASALGPLLPEPLDHVLLQADLTAVAPGPLTSDLAAELRLAADVESTGGATVYRFSEGSVRRALDAGRTAADLQALLERHSRTPVPQPLAYLVDDVGRRHGRIRVGAASSYLRCDDEALVAEVLADRRSAQLRLRRLAPTVLASSAPVHSVLERLRAMGYAPAAESPDGALVLRRPDARRTPQRQRPPRLVSEPQEPDQRLVVAAVRALRGGDRAATAVTGAAVRPGMGGPALRSSTAGTLALLQEAVAEGRPLWIGYVDAQGQASERVVEPLALEGGYLTAFDHRRDDVRTFAVHRITAVAELDEEPA